MDTQTSVSVSILDVFPLSAPSPTPTGHCGRTHVAQYFTASRVYA